MNKGKNSWKDEFKKLLMNQKDMKTSSEILKVNVARDSATYVCKLWDGIILWANSVHVDHIEYPDYDPDSWNYLSLNICLTGRCEVKLSDDRYVYMTPGNMCISREIPSEGFIYPGEMYEGLEIAFDMKALSEAEIPELSSYGLSVKDLSTSYMGAVADKVLNKCKSLYEALLTGEKSAADYRFYTLELLYLLKNGGVREIKGGNLVSKGQRKIAVETELILTKDFRERHTVEEVADRFGISPSALKKYFEAVYGKPISYFLRDRRMGLAQDLLTGSAKSVGEIANLCGYENQGKFGSAFKAYTGETPLEYRRINKVIRKEEKE